MFSKKTIRVEIEKHSGLLGGLSFSYSFSDLPIEVKINKSALPAGYSATINIYGISKSKIDSMTTIVWKTGSIDDIEAKIYVNDGNKEDLLFMGKVMRAIPDYSNAPDICISIVACAGAYYNLVTDVPPSSIKEGKQVPAPVVFEEIIKPYGLTLDYRGDKDKTVTFPRLDGDGLANRLYRAARAYNFNVAIDNVLVIVYPKDSFDYTAPPTVELTNKDYIGYPSFNDTGIQIKLDRLLYPLKLGDFFIIKGSDVSPANDKWQVIKVIYDISTKIGGRWQMVISGVRVVD